MRSFSQSLRRSPLVWLALTVVILFFVGSGIGSAIPEEEPTRPWISWVALAFIAYSALSSVVLLPRARLSEDVRPVVDWTMATAPFLIASGAALAGGDQWVGAVGLLVSLALLWRAVRFVRRSSS